MDKTAVPRVKQSDIEAALDRTYYFTASQGAMHENARWVGNCREDDAELALVTFCVIVLKNGYKVVGTSVCVHPALFDAQIGREQAREKAVDAIWPLLGYQLKDALHKEAREEREADLFYRMVGDEL